MTILRCLILILAFALPASCAADEFQEGKLTGANYARWRDHVLPRELGTLVPKDSLAVELLGSRHRGAGDG